MGHSKGRDNVRKRARRRKKTERLADAKKKKNQKSRVTSWLNKSAGGRLTTGANSFAAGVQHANFFNRAPR